MNKIYLCGILAMAAVASTSCSNEETRVNEPKSDAIEFGTYLGRDAESRASVFTIDNMNTEGFAVFASYTEDSDFSDQAIMNFMYNQKVTHDGSAWTYAPLKYWPNNPGDKVSFFAYAPYIENVAVPIANKAKVTFTVQDAVADQKDLVVAEALKNLTKQAITGNVNFTFQHVLARVGLNVEAMFDLVNSDVTGATDHNTGNGSKATGTNIKVTKVELIGKFDKEGVIDLTDSSWSGVAAAGEDVIYTWQAANFVSSVADNVTTTKQQLNDAAHYAMIIPQSVEGMKVRVTYTVTTTDASLNGGNSAITNVITSDPFDFDFAKGNAYMFNLHLGMTSVKFDATVSNWNIVGSETVVNLPINFN